MLQPSTQLQSTAFVRTSRGLYTRRLDLEPAAATLNRMQDARPVIRPLSGAHATQSDAKADGTVLWRRIKRHGHGVKEAVLFDQTIGRLLKKSAEGACALAGILLVHHDQREINFLLPCLAKLHVVENQLRNSVQGVRGSVWAG